MVLGLGTGSTVAHFLELLAERLRDGSVSGIRGVPTSTWTEARSTRLGIPLTSLARHERLDLTVDGADEVAPDLALIKGLGGALLREKMVAQASKRLVVIADGGKVVDRLGTRAPLPVEVVEWEHAAQMRFLAALGAEVALRRGAEEEPYRTDGGHVILDARFPDGIGDPVGLEHTLQARAGVVETGLFLGLADEAIVAFDDGVRSIGSAS